MNRSHDDNLDALLRRWADQNEPSTDRIDRLKARLAVASALPERNQAVSERWGSVSVGAMAISLLALSLLVACWPLGADAPSAAQELPAPVATIPSEHLRSLFAEMERLFDDRLAWVAETKHEVALGIESSPLPSLGGQCVGVRVVVLQRDSATAPWKTLWRGDVVARAEELVSLSQRDGAQLDLWTHVLPDGAVSVEMELAGPGSRSAPWRSNSVQQPDVPTAVLSTRQGDAEIQIWQTAAVLQENTL